MKAGQSVTGGGGSGVAVVTGVSVAAGESVGDWLAEAGEVVGVDASVVSTCEGELEAGTGEDGGEPGAKVGG
jgi:hypothetical protein